LGSKFTESLTIQTDVPIYATLSTKPAKLKKLIKHNNVMTRSPT